MTPKDQRQPSWTARIPPRNTPSTEPNDPPAMNAPVSDARRAGEEDHEDDREADAAVCHLTETDEEAGEHHLLVVGRHGAADGREAPQGRHEDDGLDRPHLSPSSDSGTASSPTVSATMLVSEPSWVSVRAHSTLRNGKMAESTWRDM